VSLGPLQLAGLTLHLEVLVALRPTEAKLSGIVADECDSLTRECRAGTEVTGFNTGDQKDISIGDLILTIKITKTYRMTVEWCWLCLC
jgi:hypothetical protein